MAIREVIFLSVEPERKKMLRELAKRERRSMTEVFRQALAEYAATRIDAAAIATSSEGANNHA